MCESNPYHFQPHLILLGHLGPISYEIEGFGGLASNGMPSRGSVERGRGKKRTRESCSNGPDIF